MKCKITIYESIGDSRNPYYQSRTVVCESIRIAIAACKKHGLIAYNSVDFVLPTQINRTIIAAWGDHSDASIGWKSASISTVKPIVAVAPEPAPDSEL